jgi:hypothetical protein
MKKLLSICLILGLGLLLSFSESPSPDMYKVIKVSGTIVYKKSNKLMMQGDVFPETEQIAFKSSESKASVVSTARGRFILAPGAESKNTIKDNLLPPSSNVSSRSGAMINSLDLKNYFKNNILVLGELKVKVSPAKYPLSDNSFFFIKVNFKGEKINKKLISDSGSVVFNRSEILKVDGNVVEQFENTKTILCYKAADGQITEISEFDLILPATSVILEELVLLKKEMEISDENKWISESLSYLQDFYGKTSRESVVKLIHNKIK